LKPKILEDELAREFLGNNSLKYLIYYKFLIKSDIIRNFLIRKLINRVNVLDESIFLRANQIFTDSAYSLDAISYYFGNYYNSKIKVLYLPEKITTTSETNSRLNNNPYVLLISAGRYEKNAKIVIDVIDDLISKGLFFKSVIVTGAYPSRLAKVIFNKDKFVFYNYVDSSTLENLYRFADLFIFPSLNEGFGYPPLEALKYGTKVLASNIASIPEVCGDSVFYLNPYDRESIAVALLQSIRSENKNIDHYIKTKNRQMNDNKELIQFFNSKYSELKTRLS
jgi:glycosyltransferase involved in cell wall biosynthesis